MIGALVAGPSSDRFGRKIVLTASIFLFGLFTILAAYATSPLQMGILRLLAGTGMGAAMPNATTRLSEYAPQRRRSLLITIMFTGFNLGSAVIGFTAAYMIPLHGWRSVLLLGGAVPLLLVPVTLLLLPESARGSPCTRPAPGASAQRSTVGGALLRTGLGICRKILGLLAIPAVLAAIAIVRAQPTAAGASAQAAAAR